MGQNESHLVVFARQALNNDCNAFLMSGVQSATMRRADRLFQLIQILRGARSPVTAKRMAEECETSTRTIYRDIAQLLAQHTPIRGEAGIGYVLDKNYSMPPLMLTPNEIEAAVLGAQWVVARGDPSLVRGAKNLITKIEAVVPSRLRPMFIDDTLMAPNLSPRKTDNVDIERVRHWIRLQNKMRIGYTNGHNQTSLRKIWPIAVAYFETVRLIVAWCELRQGFRHFRGDRITMAEFLNERFPVPVETLRGKWEEKETGQPSLQSKPPPQS